MKNIAATILFFMFMYLATSTFANAVQHDVPRYCIDACTGRFCIFKDGKMCDDGNPHRCVKNFKGVLILKQDQYEVCEFPVHRHAVETHSKVCFELGDGSHKSYQAAHCVNKTWQGGSLPVTCTFDNGDQETGCYKINDGCLVCAGMD